MLHNFFTWAQRPESSYHSDLGSSEFSPLSSPSLTDCDSPPSKTATTPMVTGANIILSPVFNPWLIASPDIKNDQHPQTVSTKYFTTKTQPQLPISKPAPSTHPAQFQYSALNESIASGVETPLTYRVPSNFLEKAAPKERVAVAKPRQIPREPLQPYKETGSRTVSRKVSHVRKDHRSSRSFSQPISQLQLEKYQRYAQYQPYLTKDITLITQESRRSSSVSGPNTIHLNLFHNGSNPDARPYHSNYNDYCPNYSNRYPIPHYSQYYSDPFYNPSRNQNDVLKFGFQVEFDINYAGLRRKLNRSKDALRSMLSNAKYGAKHRCHRLHRYMYRSGLTFIPVPPRY